MSSIPELLKTSLHQIEEASNAVLDHRAIGKLRNGEFSSEELKKFVSEYRHYCNVFPRLLSAVAANTPDDATRLTLISNNWEEHGEGDLSKSHRSLYDQFMTSLGVNPGSLARPAVSTERYVMKCLEYCKESHFLCGLGFLGPGTESFTNAEYSAIYNGLRQVEGGTELDLEFWEVHIGLDDDHANECIEAISGCCRTPKDTERMMEGAMFAIEAEKQFWDGIDTFLSGD